jgi:hypothetical protein
MLFEKFEKIILTLDKESQTITELYNKNVDLIDFVGPYHAVIDLLFRELYDDDGCEWINWYCYERDFGRREDLIAYDENKNTICYDLKSLWEYIEKNSKIKEK